MVSEHGPCVKIFLTKPQVPEFYRRLFAERKITHFTVHTRVIFPAAPNTRLFSSETTELFKFTQKSVRQNCLYFTAQLKLSRFKISQA